MVLWSKKDTIQVNICTSMAHRSWRHVSCCVCSSCVTSINFLSSSHCWSTCWSLRSWFSALWVLVISDSSFAWAARIFFTCRNRTEQLLAEHTKCCVKQRAVCFGEKGTNWIQHLCFVVCGNGAYPPLHFSSGFPVTVTEEAWKGKQKKQFYLLLQIHTQCSFWKNCQTFP